MTDATGLLDHPAVARVRAALAAGGAAGAVVVLAATARTAADAAASLGVAKGAIVKSLVFMAGAGADARPVMALVAGDRLCRTEALPAVLGLPGPAKRADADTVRAATGFAIGGVSPVGHPAPLPLAVDTSLGRFATIYAAAGHPHCVFATTLDELVRLTGGILAGDIGVAEG